eukprot:2127772-Rhodomonas_salina.1
MKLPASFQPFSHPVLSPSLSLNSPPSLSTFRPPPRHALRLSDPRRTCTAKSKTHNHLSRLGKVTAPICRRAQLGPSHDA